MDKPRKFPPTVDIKYRSEAGPHRLKNPLVGPLSLRTTPTLNSAHSAEQPMRGDLPKKLLRNVTSRTEGNPGLTIRPNIPSKALSAINLVPLVRAFPKLIDTFMYPWEGGVFLNVFRCNSTVAVALVTVDLISTMGPLPSTVESDKEKEDTPVYAHKVLMTVPPTFVIFTYVPKKSPA